LLLYSLIVKVIIDIT